ncbi:MAG TPA: hypothetical protein VFQ16_17645 [Burkholderiaceae bacterium]|nr:hypothetical protein [Burkholderiaceae bacterium]
MAIPLRGGLTRFAASSLGAVSGWARASVSLAMAGGVAGSGVPVKSVQAADGPAAPRAPSPAGDLPTEPVDGEALPAWRPAPADNGRASPARPLIDLPPAKAHATAALAAIATYSPFAGELLRRMGNRNAPPMVARYDDGSQMWFDFAAHAVIVEPQAWVRLRAQRTLPSLVEEPVDATALSAKATTQDLDAVAWACGLAAHALPLLGARQDWRQARLRPQGRLRLAELSRMPAHLHLCEVLACGTTTPDALRRATRVDVAELRAFLQAALFVQAVTWDRSAVRDAD